MSESTRLVLITFLTPVTWVLLNVYVIKPVQAWVNSNLPPKVAQFLTKRR